VEKFGTGPIDGAPSLVEFNNIQQGSYIISTRTLYILILFQQMFLIIRKFLSTFDVKIHI
jgi:hypothetical protein